MNIILDSVKKDKNFAALLQSVKNGELPALVNGVCDNALSSLGLALADELGKKPLFLVPDEKQANELQNELQSFNRNALFFPSRNILYDAVETYSREWEQSRISVLYSILCGECDAVITVPDALMQYTLPPDFLINHGLTLERGTSADIGDICRSLTLMGYSRAELVEGPGQFSQRGGILDVFTAGQPQPIRVDFFGDEVDLIGHFDVISQRRTDSIASAKILPVTENVCDAEGKEKVRRYIASKLSSAKLSASAADSLKKELDALETNATVLCPDKYRALLFEDNGTLTDYTEDYLVIVKDSRRAFERARAYYWEQTQALERLTDSGAGDFETAVCCMSDNVMKAAIARRSVTFDAFMNSSTAEGYKSFVNIPTKHNSTGGVTVELLTEEFSALLAAGQKVLYLTGSRQSAENALSVLTAKGIAAYPFTDALYAGKAAVACSECAVKGFELTGAGFALITEEAPRKRSIPLRRNIGAVKSEKILSYADLSVGDYVVHINHGIGKYEGLFNMVSDGVAKDFIKISYAAGDSLYVPCGQLDSVSKFIGNVETVKLHRLGGTEWHKAKAKAKAAAKSIAKELLQLYSRRQQRIAFPCCCDDELQDEFEAMFEYPETDGQLAAAKEIKADMEKEVPMERLLCGDVGFGKTEVALRAVFKAVNSGKQAAILVPTTLLAWQHFQTIKARFKGFPVDVGMLSGMNDKRINDAVVADMKSGKLDVVVGTHRLIQKDVGFKGLGLLIVDEEQRFGVTHKERIKNLAAGTHTLTLSATPIPRTLNMALSGIRDMSVLEDAPADRLPVQSYVLEYDDEIVYEAIARELRRGGQVFYLINNTDVMQSKAAALSVRFPDKVVSVGHGQMDKERLSEVWESMVKGETDILVCTTIIETGIDVPNANTLIIEDADRMGLSQLHQIRGRVGRSSRRAYAYFTYRPGKLVSEVAQKRLQAIREYTEFGSGFKIAMRDLEIRGAGNLLGSEQHGHIESIGYDLYIKLLKEAVDEEKGVVPTVERNCAIDISVNAYIPEDYINSSAMRIDIYRKIAAITAKDDADDLCDELCDRFGDMPKCVRALIDIALAGRMASGADFTSIEQKNGLIVMYNDKLDIRAASGICTEPAFKGRVMIAAGSKPHISCRLKGGESVTGTLLKLLEAYSKFANNS